MTMSRTKIVTFDQIAIIALRIRLELQVPA